MFEHGDMRESPLQVQLQYCFISFIPLTYISSEISSESHNYFMYAVQLIQCTLSEIHGFPKMCKFATAACYLSISEFNGALDLLKFTKLYALSLETGTLIRIMSTVISQGILGMFLQATGLNFCILLTFCKWCAALKHRAATLHDCLSTKTKHTILPPPYVSESSPVC